MVEQKMFADSLLETSWAQRTRRSFTTLTSFGLQAVIMGLLLLLPLLKTVGLPSTRPISTPVSLGMRGGQPAPRARTAGHQFVVQNLDPNRIILPTQRPVAMNPAADDSGPPDSPYSGPIGNGPIGDPNGPPLPFSGPTTVIMPNPPATIVHVLRKSTILEGNLVRRVQPSYPYPAKIAHVQGQVVLAAVISKAGTIENLRVLSGHPLLVPAAIDAVSQWRYRPYILNDEPVEVETQITVNFVLGGG
jgi:protein TonB